MELFYFGIYIAVIVFLVFWFQNILKKETGQTDLNWKLTFISYLAAFGLPGAVVGAISFLLRIVLYILV